MNVSTRTDRYLSNQSAVWGQQHKRPLTLTLTQGGTAAIRSPQYLDEEEAIDSFSRAETIIFDCEPTLLDVLHIPQKGER